MSSREVSIGVSVIGTIASNLTGLKGYDVMALELIQNADDSGATHLTFRINEDALYVENDSLFISCSNRESEMCLGRNGNIEDFCDWHRFREIASLNKPPGKIGRFGLGFVSVYQITDNPSVTCDGTLFEVTDIRRKRASFTNADMQPGTIFKLPWALDPNSEVRVGLKAEAINLKDLDNIATDIFTAASGSLLFLRNLLKISVYRNSKLLSSYELRKTSADERIIEIEPGKKQEHWFVAKSSASTQMRELEIDHPLLEKEQRESDVEIAIPIKGVGEVQGLIYAYLPTQRHIGMRMHVNADFWPESTRKDIIFPNDTDNRADAKANVVLIKASAQLLASSAPRLFELLGEVAFWDLVTETYEVFQRTSDPSLGSKKTFAFYWLQLEKVLSNYQFVPTENGTLKHINETILVDYENAPARRKVISNLDLFPASKNMTKFFPLLGRLGAKKPTLDVITIAIANSSKFNSIAPNSEIKRDIFDSRYLPLWDLIESLLPKDENTGVDDEAIDFLRKLPIFVSSNLKLTSLLNSFSLPDNVNQREIEKILIEMDFLEKRICEFPKIKKLSQELTTSIYSKLINVWVENKNGSWTPEFTSIYVALRELNFNRKISEDDLELMKLLQIWPAQSGNLIASKRGKIPGNFKDPLETDNLIDLSKLNKETEEFLKTRLVVEKLELRNYVTEVLPEIFYDPENKISLDKYRALILELSRNPSISSDKNCKTALQSMKIVRNINGSFISSLDACFFATDAARILGPEFGNWVDEKSIQRDKNVRRFFEDIGVRRFPSLNEVFGVWKALVSSSTPAESKTRVLDVMRYSLRIKTEWNNEAAKIEVATLSRLQCLPAKDDDLCWHIPNSLYGVEWTEAFSTQTDAQILDVVSLNKDEIQFLVNELGLKQEPEVQLVIDHLSFCCSNLERPHPKVYEFLNKSAKEKKDLNVMTSLREVECIYLEDSFKKPSKLFLDDPKIGKPWVYKIPNHYCKNYPYLIEILNIANRPSAEDMLSVLRELMDSFKAASWVEVEGIRANYYWCWNSLNLLFIQGDVSAQILEQMKRESLLLSLTNKFRLASQLLISDSDWFKSRFSDEFDEYLLSDPTAASELFKHLGVGLVSTNIEAARGKYGGEPREDLATRRILFDRRENLGVILSALDSSLSHKDVWANVSVYVVDSIMAVWKLRILGENVKSIELPAKIFFDVNKKELFLVQSEKIHWIAIFREMLQQLFPAQPENTLKAYLGLMDSVMSRSAQEGRAHLEELEYSFEEKIIPHAPAMPSSEAEIQTEMGDNESDSIDRKIESESESESEVNEETSDSPESDEIPDETNSPKKQEVRELESTSRPKERPTSDPTGESSGRAIESERPSRSQVHGQSNEQEKKRTSTEQSSSRSGVQQGENRERSGGGTSTSRSGSQSPIREAVVYVKSENEKEGQETLAIRLEIERKARELVMLDENQAGRTPEEMPPNNPGYDIESIEPDTGDIRFIELKSLAGPWGAVGVTLKIAQLNLAYIKKSAFWLYVVENVNSSNPRIYRIQNPAKFISGFKFNDSWVDFDAEEFQATPSALNPNGIVNESSAGRRIHHSEYGEGWLIKLKKQGVGSLATIDFDSVGEKHLSWNYSTMKLI